jgi:hypothetical protein
MSDLCHLRTQGRFVPGTVTALSELPVTKEAAEKQRPMVPTGF